MKSRFSKYHRCCQCPLLAPLEWYDFVIFQSRKQVGVKFDNIGTVLDIFLIHTKKNWLKMTVFAAQTICENYELFLMLWVMFSRLWTKCPVHDVEIKFINEICLYPSRAQIIQSTVKFGCIDFIHSIPGGHFLYFIYGVVRPIYVGFMFL